MFIMRMLQRLKLTNEVCLLAVIFIERLVVRNACLINVETWGSVNLVIQLETYRVHSYPSCSQVLGGHSVSSYLSDIVVTGTSTLLMV